MFDLNVDKKDTVFLCREGNEKGEREHVFPFLLLEMDSLENRPFNLFSSEDERKTPNYACRLFTGDAL